MLDFDFTFNTCILIANCSYLNVLKLNNNFLKGRIPQLVTLHSLNSKSLMFPPEIYANNRGLCGYPCAFVDGFIVGWAVSFALFLVVRWFIPLHKFTINFIRRRAIITSPRIQSLPSTNRIDNTMISMLEKFASRMSFSELSEATDSFSENNIIAIGETGITYKGTLSNGWSLAIKNLFHAPHLQHEFQSEITMLGTFRHKNLMRVVGFCHEFNGRFIIYKLMPNGNLHDYLFSSNINMEWPLRVKIAVGIANGIAWLHQNRVVHRGISSKCVLLDENYDPKISEFGKATTPNGTLNGEFSVPGSYVEDIYGFGMVLLELVMGKKLEEFISSFESIDYGDMFGLISELQATGDCEDEMCHFLRIAKKCVECDSGSCPSMVEVYQMLIGTITRYDCDTENEIQFAN